MRAVFFVSMMLALGLLAKGWYDYQQRDMINTNGITINE
jgi:hypothetical protein